MKREREVVRVLGQGLGSLALNKQNEKKVTVKLKEL